MSILTQIVNSRLDSMIDNKPESALRFIAFYLYSFLFPTTMRALVAASIIQKLEKNNHDFKSNKTDSNQIIYRIHQDHLLVILAKAMPPQCEGITLDLINEKDVVEPCHPTGC